MHVPACHGLNPAIALKGPARGPRPFPIGDPGALMFYRARNAIYHLFHALLRPGDSVLVPDYHSGNEVMAIRAAGARLVYYSIDRRMQPDLDELNRLSGSPPRALFVIHYLGWPQPIGLLRRLCAQHGMLLVEDCALSLFSAIGEGPLGSFGDYSVFCLYKTLPVPNGGLLVQRSSPLEELGKLRLRPAGARADAGRAIELSLGWLQSWCGPAGTALLGCKRAAGRALDALGSRPIPIGEIGFDDTRLDLAVSGLTRYLSPRIDPDLIVRRRRRNFLLLAERLRGHLALFRDDLPEGVCPLFFPILVRDKEEAATALARRGIETVQFWNTGDPSPGRAADRTRGSCASTCWSFPSTRGSARATSTTWRIGSCAC